MQRDADVVIVGAGSSGLACAAELARAGRSVLVLERHAAIAQEASSRNSEVVHAGLYYPEGSLKAELCVAGREALYARCRSLGIPHRQIGKLVVAVEEDEIDRLEALERRGSANGAPGLRLLDAAAVRRCEPGVHAVAALESPATGILDSHALCQSYAAEAEAYGAVFAMRNDVVAVSPRSGGYRVEAVDASGRRAEVLCAAVVNAAGLRADAVARLAGIDVDALGYRIHPCKGDYFSLAPGAPLRLDRLVYPLPAGPGLGVHATLDLCGRIRFGPDAHYLDADPEGSERMPYEVDAGKAESFARAVRRYLPGLRTEWLSPDYAGIRARRAAPGEPFADFVVAECSEHGLPGLVNLVGIESPGLTAAPAIARRVGRLLASL